MEALHVEIPTELDCKSVFFPIFLRGFFVFLIEGNSDSQWLREFLGSDQFLRMIMSDIAFKTTACPVGSLLGELEYSSFYSPDGRCW